MRSPAHVVRQWWAALGRRRGWRTVLLVALSVVAASLVAVGAVTQEVDTTVRFAVNGNGVTGELSYSVSGDGSVEATLLGAPAHGLLAGRHLVLRRHAGGRDELWDGWLSDSESSGPKMVAGTVTVTDGKSVTVLPWFGQAPGEQTVAPAEPVAAGARPVEASPVESASTSSAPRLLPDSVGAASPRTNPSGSATPWSLAGRWSTPRGVATVNVDGSRLSVTLPDGRSVSGRLTGPASLVLGLGVGCCKGDLEGPDQISWSDGTVWYRGR